MKPSRLLPPRRLPAALALSLALAVPVPGRADPVESYQKGLDAVKAGDWGAAAHWMEQAIAESPQENRRIRLYGMRFEPYVPHYYAGLARFQLGDCEGALREWEVSESHGVIQGLAEHATLAEYQGVCQERLTGEGAGPGGALDVKNVEVVEEGQEPPAEAKPEVGPAPPRPVPAPRPPPVLPQPEPPPPKPAGPDPAAVARAVDRAEAAIGEAERQDARLRQLRDDPVLSDAWSRAPSLDGPAGDASSLLGRARARLAAGRQAPDLEALEEARRLAVEAQGALSGLVRRAETRRREAQAEIARIREQETGEERRAEVAAERPEPDAEAPGGSAETVRAAARAYFDGEYGKVLETLSGQELGDEAAAAQALLFRAASRYALYLLGGEEDGALVEEAREDVAFCRRLAPDLTPDPRAFSPRFVAFFEQE